MRTHCSRQDKEKRCKFRVGLKLQITDDPEREEYFSLANWEIIPNPERQMHNCLPFPKEPEEGTVYWPKLVDITPGKSNMVS